MHALDPSETVPSFIRAHVSECAAKTVLGSAEGAVSRLWDDDMWVVISAMLACHYIWRVGTHRDWITRLLELAEHEEEMIGKFAIPILGQSFCGSNDGRGGRTLAHIVVDVGRTPSLRSTAYLFLLQLQQGNVAGAWDHVVEDATAAREERQPSLEHIDWDMVRRWLT